MSRVDLFDVDVLVPVRIDSDDRLENLETVLRYLGECCERARVWVVEHDAAPRARECASAHGAEHHFVEAAGCFHKSRVLNLAIALADRRFVLVHDCDVLCPPEALREARRRMAGGDADFVYPYNGVLLQIPRAAVREAASLAELIVSLPAGVADRSETLPAGVEFLHGSRAEPSSGAALMAERRALILAGGYNENIVSYGCEDTELATRLRKLEKRVAWLEGHNAYHVEHHRGADSRYNNFHGANLAEWRKVEAMDRDTLAAYVRNGFRSLVLDPRATLVMTNEPAEFSMRVEPSRKAALDDVAFVLPVAAAPAGLRNVVESFLDRLDAGYDGYDLALVEIGGYAWQPSSHRDHVLYVHLDAGDDGWLRELVAKTSRPIVCVCTPFADLAPESLGAALEAVRSGSPAAVVPSRLPEGLPADRASKLAALLRQALPARGDSVAFRREAFAAAAGPEAVPLDLAELRRAIDEAAGARKSGGAAPR